MASHEAARRAVAAGYVDVSVMSDGISGWRNAGERVVYPDANHPMVSGGAGG
jgi:rhodanese-related sulfurtransferase